MKKRFIIGVIVGIWYVGCILGIVLLVVLACPLVQITNSLMLGLLGVLRLL